MITNIKPIQQLQDIYQSGFFSPVRTGVDFVAKNLTGLPLVGTIASGIGSLVGPMSPRDKLMQSQFSVGGNPQLTSFTGSEASLGNKDPYGINTVSMFGNYPVYAQDKVAQLVAKGNLTPFQQQKLDFYQNVIDEESARIDRDYPGGTTFNFTDYEQDTGGDVTSSPTTEGRAAESYMDL